MSAWLRMWAWRIQESAAPRIPKWLHMLVCPFCRGMVRYVRQQERIPVMATDYQDDKEGTSDD